MAPLDAPPTCDQVTGLTPIGSANLFHRDMIMKYFLWSFSPFRCHVRRVCFSFWRKNVHTHWLTTKRTKLPSKSVVG